MARLAQRWIRPRALRVIVTDDSSAVAIPGPAGWPVAAGKWPSGNGAGRGPDRRQRRSAVAVRLYDPGTSKSGGALVYMHGGGWTLFSVATHDRLMREYAARAGIRVVGVDYSLSPEVRFPCALDEVTAVVRWLRTQGAALGIDPARIAVGGDSAGVNLALAAAIDFRDAGEGDAIRALLLNYGAFDDRCDQPSYQRYDGPAYPLGGDEMQGFWRNYPGDGGETVSARAAPTRAALHALPPAWLCIAECDVLRDENIVMADRLAAAGNAVSRTVYAGAAHSFLEAVSIAPIASRAFEDASTWLSDQLSG